MSVQEVSLLINQEHEIFYSLANSIFPYSYRNFKRFIKGNVYDCIDFIIFKYNLINIIANNNNNPYTIITTSILLHI